MAENGDLNADIRHRPQSPKNKLEGKGTSIQDVRPAMMYGAETWAVKKAQEKNVDVAEIGMLGDTN